MIEVNRILTIVGKCKLCYFRHKDGYCTNPKLEENYDNRDLKHDRLMYNYEEDGRFYVGDDFACIHFGGKGLKVPEEYRDEVKAWIVKYYGQGGTGVVPEGVDDGHGKY